MKGFGMGFFGKNHCDSDGIKKFQEKWAEMTDEQKLAFMNDRVENMNCAHGLSVEHIDAHCDEWMKRTPEEKQAWVDEINEMRKHFHHGMGGGMNCCFPRHRFGFPGE